MRIGRHTRVICLATGLVRYRDRRQAQDALASCRRSKARAESMGLTSTRYEQSVVRCVACSNGYHLSAKSPETLGGGEAA